MKKYRFDATWSGETLHENDCLIRDDKHGHWVHFEDMQATLREQEKEIERAWENHDVACEQRDKAEAEMERWKFDADTTREAHICTGRERDRLSDELATAQERIRELEREKGMTTEEALRTLLSNTTGDYYG